MATLTLGLSGKTGMPHGVGAKIVEGEVTGVSGSQATTINAKDLGLRTIYSLFATGYSSGTTLRTVVGTFTAGDYADNYASVTAFGTNSFKEVALGTFRVFAIGE